MANIKPAVDPVDMKRKVDWQDETSENVVLFSTDKTNSTFFCDFKSYYVSTRLKYTDYVMDLKNVLLGMMKNNDEDLGDDIPY